MAKKTWVISDTHFFHENILKFDNGRPEFKDVTEMNEFMVDSWNSVVRPGDKVYHLGDVGMGPGFRGGIVELMSRLNGQKQLILGNHDDVRFWAATSVFKKIVFWKNRKDLGAVLSHLPLHPQTIEDRWGGKAINIHGHIHRTASPSKRHCCVSVEQTAYTPVELELLLETLRT